MNSNEKKAYSQALLRTLTFAKVDLVRYLMVDICNTVRCRAVPTNYLKKQETVDKKICFAKVVAGGLPPSADHMVEGTGLDACDTVVLDPDLSTLRVLPYATKSALMLGNLMDQRTGMLSDLCCRGLLERVVQEAAQAHGIGVSVGAELEFCLYDEHDKPVDVSVYAQSTILNEQQDYISALNDNLAAQDIEIELIHAESAPGQLEVVLAYQTNAVAIADHIVLAKETIIATAHQFRLKAIFLPKIGAMSAGNGLHMHFSLYDIQTGRNLFESQQALSRRRQSFLLGSSKDISELGQSFIEGILQHLPALLALTLPTANSYRRVGPGCWTGSSVTWNFEDKESPVRVVANLHTQAWEHFEYKLCDSTANPYLALAGLIACGMHGIEHKIAVRPPRTEVAGDALPKSVQESLDCLEKDELLNVTLPATLLKGYLALRRAEAERAVTMSLADEVKEALDRA